jgi:hypothetical protein
MADSGSGMVAFLGVPADRRLRDQDLGALPEAEQRHEPAIAAREHDRLVAAGSLMTGTTLIGGGAILLIGGWQALGGGGGAFSIILIVAGLLLVGTHWGWVHVAEYAGLTIDDRHRRSADEQAGDWLAAIEPYPRFSVATSVLSDASTKVQRILHEPVLTPQHTFTFVRRPEAEQTYGADAPAQEIAAGVETMRRQARLDTDRLRGLWEAAAGAYAAQLLNADDDQQRLAAQRAAATALSEHLNASLLEPPLVE